MKGIVNQSFSYDKRYLTIPPKRMTLITPFKRIRALSFHFKPTYNQPIKPTIENNMSYKCKEGLAALRDVAIRRHILDAHFTYQVMSLYGVTFLIVCVSTILFPI